jgi:hypothetical protein
MTLRNLVTGVLFAMLVTTNGTPLRAQHPTDSMEWMFSNLRPAGQPVIPIFDGWYEKPDGSFDLCFGYFSLNTKESLEIPLGADNSIEPKRFDGAQPTHFEPVPGPPNLYRRRFCTFAVNVPANFGKTERVVWTLRERGKTYSVPGHLGSINYKIQELSAKEAGRSSASPLIKFLPGGPEGRGRSGVKAGPMTVAVGSPLPLALQVSGAQGVPGPGGVMDADDDEERPYIRNGKTRAWWVVWAKHQGPGDVTFSPPDIDLWKGDTSTATTKATFSAPGNYVLRVQAIDNPSENGSYQFHCCWTNGYVNVTVTK